MQTFEGIEHMLLEACTRAEMDEHTLEKEGVRGGGIAGGAGGGGGLGAGGGVLGGGAHKWHKALGMLLLFVGHLERLVFSAYEGSVVLPASCAGSAKFFRGNRKVCEDCFSRLTQGRDQRIARSMLTCADVC